MMKQQTRIAKSITQRRHSTKQIQIYQEISINFNNNNSSSIDFTSLSLPIKPGLLILLQNTCHLPNKLPMIQKLISKNYPIEKLISASTSSKAMKSISYKNKYIPNPVPFPLCSIFHQENFHPITKKIKSQKSST